MIVLNTRFFIVDDGKFKCNFDHAKLFLLAQSVNAILHQADIWLNYIDYPASLTYSDPFSSKGFDVHKHTGQLLRHPKLLGRHPEKMKIFVVGKIAPIAKNGKWTSPKGIKISPGACVLANDELRVLSLEKQVIALTHEIGHCLGLEHQETENNLMREEIENCGMLLDKDQVNILTKVKR